MTSFNYMNYLLWTSATTTCATVCLMLGGPVGAVLIDHLGFHLTFGIEFCAMLITLFALYLTLRLPQSKTSEHAAKKIEYLSAVLLLALVAVPLFALNLGDGIFPWTHPLVITMFYLTSILSALLYYGETRVALTPIAPKRFFQDWKVVIAFASTLPMKFEFDQLRFSFCAYLEAQSFGHQTPFVD